MSIGEEHQDPVSIRQEMTQLRDEVHNALQAMRQDVDLASDVNAKLVALVDSVSARTKTVEQHERIIHGNRDDKPGLLQRFTRLEDWVSSQRWFHRTVIVAAVTLVVTGTGAGIVTIIKLAAKG